MTTDHGQNKKAKIATNQQKHQDKANKNEIQRDEKHNNNQSKSFEINDDKISDINKQKNENDILKQQIMEYIVNNIENGEAINGQDIQKRFNLTDIQMKGLWNEIQIFIHQRALLNCIYAYITVEIQRNGNVQIQEFIRLFPQFTPFQAQSFIQQWINNNKIYLSKK